MREQVIWYLATANEDDHAVRVLVKKREFARAAFHCQQMAEKAFKALVAKTAQVPSSHDLSGLLHLLEKCDHFQIPEGIKEKAKRLDRFYMQSRHPQGETKQPPNSYTPECIEELHKCARVIMGFAETQLHQEIGLASEVEC